MCFSLPNLEPIGSEFTSITDADEEAHPDPLPPLPHPTPTDFGSLFVSDKDKDKSNARRQKPGHIPRPRNAFILFRSDFVQQRVPEEVINDHRDLSRLAGCMWRKMSDLQKRPWFEKAELERRYHSEVFPQYRYSPVAPERPKRVYRKKKTPVVPEEIFLMYPHRRSEPPASSTQRPASRPSPLFSSPQTSRSRLSPYLSASSTSSTAMPQRPSFPQSYTRHQPDPSRNLPSNYTTGSERAHLTPPGAFCGGFVNIPSQSSSSFDWELSPPESGLHYDDQGYWQTSEGEYPQGMMEGAYPDQASMITSTSSPDEPDSLYNMWKDLGTFHDQAFHPNDVDQQTQSSPHYHYSDFSGPANTSHHTSFVRSSLPPTDNVADTFPMAHNPLTRSS